MHKVSEIVINQTTDYDWFKRMLGNREVKRSKVEKLKKAFVNGRNLTPYIPIQVFPDGRIAEGQHRFQACKELGLPVYYIVIPEDVTIETVAQINTDTDKWTRGNHISTFAERGYPAYLFLKDFTNRHNLTYSSAIIICGVGNGRGGEALRSGGLNIGHPEDVCEEMAEVVKELAKISPAYKNDKVIHSLMHLRRLPGFDFSRLIAKSKYQADKIRPFAKLEDNLRLLESIYNCKLRSESEKLRFF